MALFDFLKKKQPVDLDEPTQFSRDELVQIFRNVFPGGPVQRAAEGSDLFKILGGLLSKEEATVLLTQSKTLLYQTEDKSFARLKDYIITRSANKLSEQQALQVYEFICTKLKVTSIELSEHKGNSVDSPIKIEKPDDIESIRERFRSVIKANGDDAVLPPEITSSDHDMDRFISEFLKMTVLEDLLGAEEGRWECGKRIYLANSIQTQEILFMDGRPPVTYYFDFSSFGSFE